MENNHCDGHSGTVTLLNEHSKGIADLYDKHDDTRALLGEIKLCMGKMSIKLDIIQDQLKVMQIDRVEKLVHYDAIIADFKNQFNELNEFKWFRVRMNKLRNNLPSIVVGIIMTMIGFLAMLSWTELGELFAKRLK